MIPNIPAEWLVGPVAALALALIVIGFLGKLLLDYINFLKAKVAEAMAGWQDQTKATERLADVLETRYREDEMRRRYSDEDRGQRK